MTAATSFVASPSRSVISSRIDVFVFSQLDDSDTLFFGGVAHANEVATLVFLGSLRRNLLLSGGLVPSRSIPEALLSWWTDGHCDYMVDTIHEARDQVYRNMAQLIGEPASGELLLGLRRLTSAADPHPVIQRNLAPFFSGLLPELPDGEAVRVVAASDQRLLRLLWDQLEARYRESVQELEATDDAVAALRGWGPEPTPGSHADAATDELP